MESYKVVTRFLFGMCIFLNFGLSTSASHCTQSYTTDDGKTCSYCPPGTYVSRDCEESGQSANCHGCEPGYYQRNCTRASSCAKCATECRWKYTIKVKDCTLYNDIICQCVAGRYWKNDSIKEGVCLRHSMCGPGFGLVALGSATDDTLCEPCVKGQTFSSDYSIEQCHACSKCQVYIDKCSDTVNAVCDNSSTTETPLESSTNTKGDITQVTIIVITIPFFVVVFTVAMPLYLKRRHLCKSKNTPGNTRGIQNHNSHPNADVKIGNNAEEAQTLLEMTQDNQEAAISNTDDRIRNAENGSPVVENAENRLTAIENEENEENGSAEITNEESGSIKKNSSLESNQHLKAEEQISSIK